ncbi:hypothetical protein D3870_09810 [Noviherbaspirillum cavernae]|uniref:Uncharacterized protein n=1 Tax=Noviherbaspirillum cavernae TaxID=2320862 RepID=A0A418X1E9_9BURK|nr:hypothetical protein [Noviherbaspirillum cavernae]RJG06268.1 hypothetical protein D3870_09810 [Noviherbaspirillum cavernae]
MSSLYGKLASQLTRQHEVQTSAFHANAATINRFGDAVQPLDLVPHVQALDAGKVRLSANCTRGRDHQPVFTALAGHGYTIGEPELLPQQFNDGYLMWTVSVTGSTLQFKLLFYTRTDVRHAPHAHQPSLV